MTSKDSRPASLQRLMSEELEESAATIIDDPGYEFRNRSASRRRRRKNQRQRNVGAVSRTSNATSDSRAMSSLPEDQNEDDDAPGKLQSQTQGGTRTQPRRLNNPATQDTTESQPFEHINPPSQSMNRPVTYARMNRGEIPWRGLPPPQPYNTTQGVNRKTHALGSMKQDGLKLRLELNLDIEIELKAHIHGDITLALLA